MSSLFREKTPAPSIARYGKTWGNGACGYALGIIVVETDYPLLPGNVANASSFPFPVYVKVLKGITGSEIMEYNPDYTQVIIDAGNELVGLGVRAVVGACGSFANYQKAVAKALPVPTYLSVMLQTSLVALGLQPGQSIGVIAARAEALTERVFEQCSIVNPECLHIYSAMDLSELNKLFDADPDFDNDKLERDLVALAQKVVQVRPDTGAVILQCSDLPPYAAAIERALGLPVYDQTTLMHWVYNAVVREPFQGHF